MADRLPKRNLFLMMGECNAKVGYDNQGMERAMEKHGTGIINQTGKGLTELCLVSVLILARILFPHNDIDKETQTSPDGKTKNQTDLIFISSSYSSFVQHT